MVVLEEPYVSETLLNYLEKTQMPVLKNDFSVKQFSSHEKLNLIEGKEFLYQYHSMSSPLLYTVSEYALDGVCNALKGENIVKQVTLLKDKYAFRKACDGIYNDFLFKEINYLDLFTFDISKIHLPVVLKPSVGFLSAGVYTIESFEDWKNAINDIENNFKSISDLFPDTVVGDNRFIIESYIKGTEYAIDVYFRDKEPVIINIFEHRFSSTKDVSDRLYLTNKALFDKYLEVFTDYIRGLNSVLNLNNIAVHIEMRADGKTIIPIEINPLRFTGMCLNELFCKFVGEHPLTYFFTRKTPDYNAIWKGRENKTYYFSIIEKPEGVKDPILDIDKLKMQFSNILELRLINNPKLNILAHVFAEIDGNTERELHNITILDIKTLLK